MHISMAHLVYRWLGGTSGTLLGHFALGKIVVNSVGSFGLHESLGSPGPLLWNSWVLLGLLGLIGSSGPLGSNCDCFQF